MLVIIFTRFSCCFNSTVRTLYCSMVVMIVGSNLPLRLMPHSMVQHITGLWRALSNIYDDHDDGSGGDHDWMVFSL
jgi:hypothetical protein